jgi:GxxExxY protein
MVEVKAVEQLNSVDEAQLPSYFRWTRFRIGLLINFQVPMWKNGIRRIANEFPASAISACSALLGQ